MQAAAPTDTELVARCRNELKQGRSALHEAYAIHRNPVTLLTESARLVDGVLRRLWLDLGMDPALALVAVGGYGRGELYPASDVDLLILVPNDPPPYLQQTITRLVGQLWDIGLDVGHSVRTVDECLEAAGNDITVQTALLEARLLCGNEGLFARYDAAFHADLDPLDFFRAKRLEQEERYAKHNDTAFSLEPNCKENPGGLRDLQVILWVTRAAGLCDRWRRLAATAIASPAEARQLARCEDFLRRVRIGLHLLTGRREDRLLFDHQEGLAQALGFTATPTRRAAEVLMQHYYRNAKRVTQLNTLLLLDLASRLDDRPPPPPIVLDEHFQMVRGLLDMRDDALFEQRPAALLEGFLLLSRHGELKGMTPRTLRALWRARGRIDAAFRRNPHNQRNFIALFREKRGLTHQLRRMNQFDILGAYLPAFGRIVGRMQHDLFHVYTVDQHILQVVRNLRRLALPEFAHEYPFCSRLMASLQERWRLYLAALFHDIAKGRGGDHSQLGKQDARRFCRAQGIDDEDADLICFLVEHHLTMSSVAQKEDLTDPEVIHRFARIVRTGERLTALYLLTVCDIRGTSPKVWNVWKAKLLEDLFRITSRLLAGESVAQLAGLEERQEDARRLLRLRGLQPDVESALWQQLDTGYFLRHDSEEVSWHTQLLYYRPAPDKPVVKARLNPAGAGLQVMIYTPDRPELFARLCGFFARLGYSIVDAKIHTTRHGFALDSFALLGDGNQQPYRDMIALIEHELTLHLVELPPLAAPPKSRISRQVRHVPLNPEVSVRADESRRHTLLSVTAADRSGLLYDIARILSRHGIQLHAAKIATLGERVEDTFLISGADLEKTATLVRLEQELLEALQI
jgi:[protein-PII] uridylyltransferase